MNNFRITFNEDVTLEIDGNKIGFKKGMNVGFRNVSDGDTYEIRKSCIKDCKFTFKMTDDTTKIDKLIYGDTSKKNKRVVDSVIKAAKGNKKDKFKDFIPKTTVKEEEKEDKSKIENIENKKGVKNTQKSLKENTKQEIIKESEDKGEVNENE